MYRNISACIILSVMKDNAAMFGIDEAGTMLKYITIPRDIKKIILYSLFMINQKISVSK